ncbi:MAG: uroporphyrinogen-III synthase [Acidobacteriaceae bacterium]|nr:uroporphyrinogen-III synthase [Acidobacteriaceae bacterium]
MKKKATSSAKKSPQAGRKAAPSAASPLAGERVLVTRAREQASALAEELRALGAEVIEIPAIEIRPPSSYVALDTAIHAIEDYDWLILTSVNGVKALFSRLAVLGSGIEKLLHLNIAAIGPATSAAIEQEGLPVDVVPEDYVAESVVTSLRDSVRGKRVLLVRAKVARDVIPKQLTEAGATVDVIEAYETVVPEESRNRLREVLGNPAQRPTTVTFTSSSTARNFMELLGNENTELLNGVTLASIGPVTTATLEEIGLRADVEADEYTIPGLARAISERSKL